MNYVIRKAIPDDAQAILDINIKSWKDTYRDIFPTDYLNNLCSNPDDYEKAVQKNVQKIKNDNNFFVAEIGNDIVGFCSFGNSRKEMEPLAGEIYALYVDKKYHGNCIGKELFNHAKQELLQKYDKVIVSCLVQNNANDFYKKMGCIIVGTCDFILDGNSYQENLYMINLE